MYIVSSESAFDAAHFLTNYEGKCKNIHGHRWRIVAEVKGELNNGMLIDFGILKKDLKNLCDYFDHSFIVEKNSLKDELLNMLKEQFLIREVSFRTTAENFSKYFFESLQKKGYDVVSVSVYETPTNKAEYRI